MRDNILADWRDVDLIRALQNRGYEVNHKSARRALSWSRTAPYPTGLDFEAEALSEIRAQITPEMITFQVDPGMRSSEFSSPEIHRAILRIL